MDSFWSILHFRRKSALVNSIPLRTMGLHWVRYISHSAAVLLLPGQNDSPCLPHAPHRSQSDLGGLIPTEIDAVLGGKRPQGLFCRDPSGAVEFPAQDERWDPLPRGSTDSWPTWGTTRKRKECWREQISQGRQALADVKELTIHTL